MDEECLIPSFDSNVARNRVKDTLVFYYTHG